MTREDAIRWLKLDIDMTKFDPSTGQEAYLNDDAQKVIEAQEMAIQALSAEGDTISRQAATDVIKKHYRKYDNDLIEVIAYEVEQLPPAQPEIIACGDCKHWICHDRRCGYWNHGVKPLDWCCYAERRENG